MASNKQIIKENDLFKKEQEAFTRDQRVFNKNMEASLRNLENQVGQLASNLSRRLHGTLPSNTEKNPREEVNTVTLRNGRELEEVEKELR